MGSTTFKMVYIMVAFALTWDAQSHFLLLSILQEVTTALERFERYHPIWQKERDETVAEFLEQKPKLSDFQATIVHYRELEEAIMAEPEFYNVGAIALYTGDNSCPFALKI